MSFTSVLNTTISIPDGVPSENVPTRSGISEKFSSSHGANATGTENPNTYKIPESTENTAIAAILEAVKNGAFCFSSCIKFLLFFGSPFVFLTADEIAPDFCFLLPDVPPEKKTLPEKSFGNVFENGKFLCVIFVVFPSGLYRRYRIRTDSGTENISVLRRLSLPVRNFASPQRQTHYSTPFSFCQEIRTRFPRF